MQIEFNCETWELNRMPGYWIMEREETGTSISFYNNESVEELKERLKKIEKNT